MLFNSLMADVMDFHRKFDLDYNGPPRKLKYELFEFRLKFMEEELEEFAHAQFIGDEKETLVQQLDAILDLIYVALGTAHLMGFNSDILNGAWQRIQKANMAKIRVESAADSKRGSTFDVVKPEGWMPPQFGDLF